VQLGTRARARGFAPSPPSLSPSSGTTAVVISRSPMADAAAAVMASSEEGAGWREGGRAARPGASADAIGVVCCPSPASSSPASCLAGGGEGVCACVRACSETRRGARCAYCWRKGGRRASGLCPLSLVFSSAFATSLLRFFFSRGSVQAFSAARPRPSSLDPLHITTVHIS